MAKRKNITVDSEVVVAEDTPIVTVEDSKPEVMMVEDETPAPVAVAKDKGWTKLGGHVTYTGDGQASEKWDTSVTDVVGGVFIKTLVYDSNDVCIAERTRRINNTNVDILLAEGGIHIGADGNLIRV